MNQKRFLTAGEVFQLFGVDTEMLDQLVEAGDVQALQDLGSFKYRREDFVKLVHDGRLSPRTAGEMFQVDSQGDIPFLKLKQEDDALKFGEDVEFLELDEDALNEQADRPQSKTPIGPENRMGDSDETGSMQTSREVSVFDAIEKSPKERTDFEVSARDRTESDSNVRLVSDDTIDFDDPEVISAGSDSDVRLSGPVSSSKPGSASKAESESDVHLFKMVSDSDESDSDVTILSGAAIPPTPKSAAKSGVSSSPQLPDSDSDVQIAPSGVTPVAGAAPKSGSAIDSDSDIILVGSPSDPKVGDPKSASSKLRLGKKPDSDSDVRLSNPPTELSPSNPHASIHTDTDSDVKLSDSTVRLEATPMGGMPAMNLDEDEPHHAVESGELNLESLEDEIQDNVYDGDSSKTVELVLEAGDDANDFIPQSLLESPMTEPELPVQAAFESELRLHEADDDSGISLDDHLEGESESEFTLKSSGTDIDIAIEPDRDPDSGLSLEVDSNDSGIALDQSETDSGISLEPAAAEHRAAPVAQQSESDIVLSALQDDSNIRLGSEHDSGLSLAPQSADSGIMLDETDSGIRFESTGDSGISLADADSGIAVASGDSGISLEDDSEDLGATFADVNLSDFDAKPKKVSQTETFEARDSGFDVSLAESDNTMEMVFEDEDGSADTIVDRGKKGASGTKSLDLSEAFQLDEPLEVEDLDISEDLDAAVGSDFSDEFASIDEEEVVEVSDDDFSVGEVSAVEDADDDSLEPSAAAATKRRAVPTEPSWGMAAIAPIIGASLAMAVTVLVLWGGISTMWDGSEAGGPAAMLISMLGGLI